MMTENQLAKVIKQSKETMDEIDVALKAAEDAVDQAMQAMQSAIDKLIELRSRREVTRLLDNISAAARSVATEPIVDPRTGEERY